jgi:hypothetical protein
MFRLDERSSPELYVGELIARFASEEPARLADLRAFAEHVEGGQLEDALIELLGATPDEALAGLLRWREAQRRAGVPDATVRRRLESIRRLCTLAEREFADASLVALAQARHGGTLAQHLARALATAAPN